MKKLLRWIVIAVVAAACGGDSTGSGYEEFIVAHFTNTVDNSGSPTIIVSETAQVTDTGSTAVQGALVRFHVTTGSVVPGQATSGSGGFTGVTWTLTGQAGHTENLTACASNSASRCDTYRTLVTIVF